MIAITCGKTTPIRAVISIAQSMVAMIFHHYSHYGMRSAETERAVLD